MNCARDWGEVPRVSPVVGATRPCRLCGQPDWLVASRSGAVAAGILATYALATKIMEIELPSRVLRPCSSEPWRCSSRALWRAEPSSTNSERYAARLNTTMRTRRKALQKICLAATSLTT